MSSLAWAVKCPRLVGDFLSLDIIFTPTCLTLLLQLWGFWLPFLAAAAAAVVRRLLGAAAAAAAAAAGGCKAAGCKAAAMLLQRQCSHNSSTTTIQPNNRQRPRHRLHLHMHVNSHRIRIKLLHSLLLLLPPGHGIRHGEGRTGGREDVPTLLPPPSSLSISLISWSLPGSDMVRAASCREAASGHVLDMVS